MCSCRVQAEVRSKRGAGEQLNRGDTMNVVRGLLFGAAMCVVAQTAVQAADFPVKPTAVPAADSPFFFVNDNRLTYAYEFAGTEPGNPGKTSKQVLALTHFDVWAYGTNFANLLLLKDGHGGPAAPCSAFQGAGCAGQTEFYGLLRSTFGFNQIFDTKAFSTGPLQNVSFEIGGDAEVSNALLAPAKKAFVAGLQFAFNLPYQGYFNIAPLYYKEWDHVSYLTPFFTAPGPGIVDGNLSEQGTWALELNYYLPLGSLPESIPLAVSGRMGIYGARGTGTNLTIPGWLPTKTEVESEPIRLTLDASKMIWGPKYSHHVDIWVAYKYWQNKYGLDHSKSPFCQGLNIGSCTESSVYSGLTVKF